MMSKKDYVKFAMMIQDRDKEIDRLISESSSSIALLWQEHQVELIDMAYNMADIFAEDNPNFDREKFLKACGLSS